MHFNFKNLGHNFFSLFYTNDIKEEDDVNTAPIEMSTVAGESEKYVSFVIKIDNKYKDTVFSISYIKKNFQRMIYTEENTTCIVYLNNASLTITDLSLEDYCKFKQDLTEDGKNV